MTTEPRPPQDVNQNGKETDRNRHKHGNKGAMTAAAPTERPLKWQEQPQCIPNPDCCQIDRNIIVVKTILHQRSYRCGHHNESRFDMIAMGANRSASVLRPRRCSAREVNE